MLNDSQLNLYACLKEFRNLNGWHKQEVIVGDHPDARVARFFLRDRVKNNWSTHWRTRYTGGYIRFQYSRKIFDCAKQTIDGDPAYIFRCTPVTDILWRRQMATRKIEESIEKAFQRDKATIEELIWEISGSVGRAYRPRYLRHQVTQVLSDLSVGDLEDLATLLAIPNGSQAACLSSAAS
jgi:hypothetical protein